MTDISKFTASNCKQRRRIFGGSVLDISEFTASNGNARRRSPITERRIFGWKMVLGLTLTITILINQNLFLDSSWFTNYTNSSSFSYANSSLVIVTGASQNHLKPLLVTLLPSIEELVLLPNKSKLNVTVIFYDLDDNPKAQVETRQTLAKRFPFVEYRIFDYGAYPSYFNINQASGEYAFKPVIIDKVVSQYQNISSNLNSFVYWLDSGIMINKKHFGNEFEIAHSQGIYSPASHGTLKEWTVEGAAKYLGLDDEIYQNNSTRICSANIVLIDAKNASIVDNVIKPWADCAKHKACIAPPGSGRGNHRQDQSALSILLHKRGIQIHTGTGSTNRGLIH
eukprot:CAMPEP_0198256098 /NCGR_PEP_ID=MMETSP1447-20131203/6086_1 /TAXON_ID=420782 /ORGANISM="Chaetoceros dichaeta, Strain CCMP1751" /LENGTH=338 /DNA_ID=CAMNT_0043942651 /DNA_START=78 /DNA_END=1094 /DNA_ORIENTATION=-